MRIAGKIQDSIVDGPGFRFVVFAQGCRLRCEGCHNLGTWDENGGDEASTGDIIKEMLSNPLTDGLTLSGGEPFLQARDCAEIAAAARDKGLSVWIYTGYTLEELKRKAEGDSDIARLLGLADVLVDGPFELPLRSLSLKWRGSKNQRVIDVRKSFEAGETVELPL